MKTKPKECPHFFLADYNGDTAAYLRDAQLRLEASGRPIWQGKQRTKHRIEVADQPLPDGTIYERFIWYKDFLKKTSFMIRS